MMLAILDALPVPKAKPIAGGQSPVHVEARRTPKLFSARPVLPNLELIPLKPQIFRSRELAVQTKQMQRDKEIQLH